MSTGSSGGIPPERILAPFGELDDPATPLTATEVADAVDCARRTAYNKLETLADRGELETKKVGARGRVWWRPSRVDGGAASDSETFRHESLISGALDAANVGVFVLDAELDVAWINEATERYFGLDRASILGRDKRELVREEISNAVGTSEAFVETVLATYRDNTYSEEFECHVAPGEGRKERWLEHRSEPIKSGPYAGGRIELYYDVTERRELERQLERQRDGLRNELDEVYERITDAFHTLDADWRFDHVNERAEALIGRTESELRGRYIWDVLPEAAERSFKDQFERAMETQESVTFEEHLPAADMWLEVHAYPSESGLSVYFRDISERKARGQELERYETILEAVGDPVYTLDSGGYLTFVNDAFCETFDVDREDVLGEYVSIAMADDDIERAREVIRGLLSADSRDSATLEYEMSMLDQTPTPVENNITLLPFGEEGTFQGTAGVLRDVTARKERELELQRQRAELTALNNLNSVVRDINEAVIEQSTRAEIERTVCDSLAESGSYRFAWIGDVDPKTHSIDPRMEAGVDGYLDAVRLSTDPDDPRGQGLAGEAARTKEMQATQHALDDPDFERWHEYAREYGYRSAAAIPIVHRDTLYGILGVYAERPEAFAGGEGEVIGRLSEIVGHAIASVERKRALMSDDVVEVKLRVPDRFDTIATDVSTDGTITLDRIVPLDNEVYLQYGTATEDAIPVLDALVEHRPHWEDVSFFDRRFGPARFEARLSDPPVLSLVASHGGALKEATIEDDDLHMTIHLSPNVDMRRIVDAIKEMYPATEMVTRRQITRSETAPARIRRVLTEELTERQRAALEVAFYSGFFEWPRKNSGEEIALSMDVSPTTFHQHLRKAEQKLLDGLLADDSASE